MQQTLSQRSAGGGAGSASVREARKALRSIIEKIG